jgi:hypothetical protein
MRMTTDNGIDQEAVRRLSCVASLKLPTLSVSAYQRELERMQN